MEGPPLGPGGEDITWPDQVAPRGRKASSTRKIKPQTSLSMRLFPDSSNSSKRREIFFCSSNTLDKDSWISVARLSFEVVDTADVPLLVVDLFVFVKREV